jgi:hypothetical protein
MDEWMGVWMDGWMDGCTVLHAVQYRILHYVRRAADGVACPNDAVAATAKEIKKKEDEEEEEDGAAARNSEMHSQTQEVSMQSEHKHE